MAMAVASPRRTISQAFLQMVGRSYFNPSSYSGIGEVSHSYFRIRWRLFNYYVDDDEVEDEVVVVEVGDLAAGGVRTELKLPRSGGQVVGERRRTKNVLILMSDTRGGHRASAEAIRDTFRIEFGDKYQIFVKDLWKEYTGWPLNDMERSYKFMHKYVQLWKVAFHGTSPRWIHSAYLAAFAAYYSKEVEAGLMEYKPDIIISVHPLMQHIPLWVLKWQSLHEKVIFVTVITDLNSCHRTWFHPGVNRCYCPSPEVAKRSLLDGLDESQVQVLGLPIRPSFAHAINPKDELREELGHG